MKIGVAQIPVTMDAKINYETIVKACDWAVANGVDYLMTPEASVSGYDAPSFTVNTCQDTEDAVKKLQEYCSKNGLGLILGTLWLDEKDVRHNFVFGKKTNQLRFINQQGEHIGTICKRYIVHYDTDCQPGEPGVVVELTTKNEKFKVGAMICNDLVGNYWDGTENLVKAYSDKGVQAILHASNADKDLLPYIQQAHDDWHLSCVKMMSYASNVPLITVDNPWSTDGRDNKKGASMPSGVFLPFETLYQAPKQGTQYFWYDTNTNKIGSGEQK